MAAEAIVDLDAWAESFESAFARIAGRFRRAEPRLAARAWLLGVLSDVDTRSCWQLAEQAGHRTPHRMQSLLAEAKWDADAVRDDLRRYVADELGEPDGVLMIRYVIAMGLFFAESYDEVMRRGRLLPRADLPARVERPAAGPAG